MYTELQKLQRLNRKNNHATSSNAYSLRQEENFLTREQQCFFSFHLGSALRHPAHCHALLHLRHHWDAGPVSLLH
jgi:hypothetical protein